MQDLKIWINPEEPLNNLGTEVIDSMEGNQTNLAPSVNAVKNYVNNYSTEEKVVGIYDNKPLYRKMMKINNKNKKVIGINKDYTFDNLVIGSFNNSACLAGKQITTDSRPNIDMFDTRHGFHLLV